jgi:hypothetical protein
MFKETIQESVKLSSSNIEVLNNIEQVNILFKWCGQNALCSEVFSVWEWLSSGKKVIFWWRQGLVFIHNIVELQGMQRMNTSHPWKTHGTILSIPKASVKFLWVVSTHKKLFTATQGPRLWSRAQGGHLKVIWTKWFPIRKVASNSAKLYFLSDSVALLELRLI